MKLVTRVSTIGLVATVGLFVVLNQFAIQVRDRNPEFSIPLASTFIFCLLVMAGSLIMTLRRAEAESNLQFGPGVVFLGGYALSTILVVVAMFGLPEHVYQLKGELFAQPFVALPTKLGEVREALATSHWWTHLVLGIALLVTFITTLALFLTTDSASALTASVAGPLYGLCVVLGIAAAAAVLMAIAMGLAVLAVGYVKLMLLSEQ